MKSIETIILTVFTKGEDAIIPKIPLILKDVSFWFRRLKFPVCLSFAMSINKSQRFTVAELCRLKNSVFLMDNFMENVQELEVPNFFIYLCF